MDRTEVYEDSAGEFRWRRIAPNQEVIADSGEGYTRKSDAERAARRAFPEASEALGKGGLRLLDETTTIRVKDETGRVIPFDRMDFLATQNILEITVQLRGFGVPV